MSNASFKLQELTLINSAVAMPANHAVDVGAHNYVNVQLRVPLLPPSSGSPAVSIILEHSMSREESSFEPTGQAFLVNSSFTVATLTVSRPNRYLRWRAAVNAGSPFPIQFMMDALGRDA